MTDWKPPHSLYPREKDAIRCLLERPLVKSGRFYTHPGSLSKFSGETVGSLIAMGVAERYGTTEIRLTDKGRDYATLAIRFWYSAKGKKYD